MIVRLESHCTPSAPVPQNFLSYWILFFTLSGVISLVLSVPASALACDASLFVIPVLKVEGITVTIAPVHPVSVLASTSH